MAPYSFIIRAEGSPQAKGTRWFATETGSNQRFLVGKTVSFRDGDGDHRGITQTGLLKEIPQLYYDRSNEENRFGPWAHFIWPTVYAESSGGHHLLVNTYDRARFTFGFYQLAAHTPNDNLILLFRQLLGLPKAAAYFPDLTLESGRVYRVTQGGETVSLETATNVTRPNGKTENQIVGFMTYLNPDTQNAGEIEALNTAKLIHWFLSDPAAVSESVATAIGIMKRKLKSAAQTYGLSGRRPELAIWVSDILHHGRGTSAEIRNALAAGNFDAQIQSLFLVGSHIKAYDGRRKAVQRCISTLISEARFAGLRLGQGALAFD